MEKSKITIKDPLPILQSYHVNRVLSLYDESAENCKMLLNNAKNDVDKIFVNCLKDYLNLRIKLDELSLTKNDIRTAIQKIYNKLNKVKSKRTRKIGLLPEWVIDSEIVRLEVLLKRFGNEYWSDFRQNAVEDVNKLRYIFEKSKGKDLSTLFSIIQILLELSELSHTRQALLEATAIAPAFPLFYIGLAYLSIDETRYKEALKYVNICQELVGHGVKSATLLFLKSYCNYFLGNFEQAIQQSEEGIDLWPKDAGLRNNYTFARARLLYRDLRGGFWKDRVNATALLDDFLKSIFEIGANEAAHFNYALLLFWADNKRSLDVAKNVLRENLERYDLIKAKNIVEQAFIRAKNAYLGAGDYFHVVMCTYFAERSKLKRKKSKIELLILDELLWDADNFISFKYKMDKMRNAFLNKENAIKSPLDFNHLATLKRWKGAVKSYSTYGGGGYFIKWQGKGIVINPGGGFINNFLRRGYSISEIDSIIVSTPKYSAYDEFIILLDLIEEYSKKQNNPKVVEVLLDRRVFHRFPDIGLRYIQKILNIDILPNDPKYIKNNLALINNIFPRSIYEDETEKLAINQNISGILSINLLEKKKIVCSIGFILDFFIIEKDYELLKKFDLIVLNIGNLNPLFLWSGIITEKIKSDLSKLFTDDAVYKESFGLGDCQDLNEFYLRLNKKTHNKKRNGINNSEEFDELFKIVEKLARLSKIVILSDLPQELADKRHLISKVLNNYYPDKTVYLTEDIGLVVGIPNLKILCDYDFKLTSVNNIDEECAEGVLDGPIKHFCKKHRGYSGFGELLSSEIY